MTQGNWRSREEDLEGSLQASIERHTSAELRAQRLTYALSVLTSATVAFFAGAYTMHRLRPSRRSE
jgi:hypothetical protein